MKTKLISVILTIAVVFSLALVLGAPPVKVALAQVQDCGYNVTPQTTKITPGDSFTVDIWAVDDTNHKMWGWDINLSFAPNFFNITSVDTPSSLPGGATPDFNPNMPQWDNTTGEFLCQYSIGIGETNVTQSFSVLTIHFVSLGVEGTTELEFLPGTGAYLTDILDPDSADILNWTMVVNGTVKVGTPKLTVNVTPADKGDVDITGASIPSSYPNNTTWAWDDVVNLEAVNSTAGWGFVNWTGDVADANATSTTVTMANFTQNATANFEELPPEISPDPANLTFSGNVGEAVTNQTLQICNGGGHTLNWTANITGTNVTWLSMSPMNGTNLTAACNFTECNLTKCNSTEVAVNTTDLPMGIYHANITINSTDTGVVNKTVPVTLNLGVPAISASPIPLTFTTNEGENPADKTLEIWNSGTGTLNWELTDNAAWLGESLMSDSSTGVDDKTSVTVSVDASGMAAGDYSATITITGSPTVTVPVTLNIVSAMPELPVAPAQLSASGLSISPQQVQPGLDVTISINVANTGGETGSYNAVLYINGVVEDSQSVSVAGGTSKNVIFTVTKSKAGVYDVSVAGQNGQFEVVGGGWFAGGLGTGGIIAIVVVVIVLIAALVFILRGTTRPE